MGVACSIGLHASVEELVDRTSLLLSHLRASRPVEGQGEARAPLALHGGPTAEVVRSTLAGSGRLLASGELELPGAPLLRGARLVVTGRGWLDGSGWRRDGLVRVGVGVEAMNDPGTGPALFNAICTGGAEQAAPAQHGALYWEAGWPSGPLCPMVFHRDPREFALDLGRACRERDDRAWPVELLGHEPWTAPIVAMAGSLLPATGPFSSQVHEGRQVAKFLRGLDEDAVRGVASLGAEEIRTALVEVASEVDGVTAVDLGARGLTIAVCPLVQPSTAEGGRGLGTVWRAYERLVELAA